MDLLEKILGETQKTQFFSQKAVLFLLCILYRELNEESTYLAK